MSSQPPFIQVGALAEGFAPNSHSLAPRADLEGRTLALGFDDGTYETLIFDADGRVRSRSGAHACRVTSLRDGIFLIDYVGGGDGGCPSTTSVVADLRLGLCTVVTGRLPDEDQTRVAAFTRVERGLPLTGVDVRIRHGRIEVKGANRDAPLHRPTVELVGMRNLYTYSKTERYEHIYLNADFYAWHCLSGAESGLADVDRCHTVGIADKLYLFVWCEKIIPTLGVLLIDLEQMKTDGKVFGYESGHFDSLSNFPVGAFAQVLNVTTHPE
ncbi:MULTISPECIES: MoaF C-terminal domain-containing protein [Paraburkholderia]|uniref:MoaF C-terminal domain-containing protein n=1 Tax=Paraburkholderia TaxID=1822464 RepID=UPI00036C9828|nr:MULTISPECIES: MoaF C-terminal domain-containing protein [Paraburkholderia]MDH6148186.1 hypothetical protein [Paraburkholderia sp. WSM4179]